MRFDLFFEVSQFRNVVNNIRYANDFDQVFIRLDKNISLDVFFFFQEIIDVEKLISNIIIFE